MSFLSCWNTWGFPCLSLYSSSSSASIVKVCAITSLHVRDIMSHLGRNGLILTSTNFILRNVSGQSLKRLITPLTTNRTRRRKQRDEQNWEEKRQYQKWLSYTQKKWWECTQPKEFLKDMLSHLPTGYATCGKRENGKEWNTHVAMKNFRMSDLNLTDDYENCAG